MPCGVDAVGVILITQQMQAVDLDTTVELISFSKHDGH